jgi:hypothetical protein
MLEVGPGSAAQRTCTSYDVELEALVAVIQAETEKGLLVLFDSTSPVDAALSFAAAHD